MKPLMDLFGQTFARLTVIGRAENDPGGKARWRCRCECGGETVAVGRYLRAGLVQSCGCLKREAMSRVGRSTRTHGHAVAETPEYKAWRAALGRCHNPRHKQFADYGGRGIAVAPEWRANFQAFLNEVGPRPSPQHSLDRRDNDRGYEPGNVRWATAIEQHNNTRSNRIVEVDGQRMTLAAAIRAKGLKSSTVRQRLAMGWPMERALT